MYHCTFLKYTFLALLLQNGWQSALLICQFSETSDPNLKCYPLMLKHKRCHSFHFNISMCASSVWKSSFIASLLQATLLASVSSESRHFMHGCNKLNAKLQYKYSPLFQVKWTICLPQHKKYLPES